MAWITGSSRVTDPAELEPVIRELLAAGTPVALVIGGVGEADPDGIEVLARVRAHRPDDIQGGGGPLG